LQTREQTTVVKFFRSSKLESSIPFGKLPLTILHYILEITKEKIDIHRIFQDIAQLPKLRKIYLELHIKTQTKSIQRLAEELKFSPSLQTKFTIIKVFLDHSVDHLKSIFIDLGTLINVLPYIEAFNFCIAENPVNQIFLSDLFLPLIFKNLKTLTLDFGYELKALDKDLLYLIEGLSYNTNLETLRMRISLSIHQSALKKNKTFLICHETFSCFAGAISSLVKLRRLNLALIFPNYEDANDSIMRFFKALRSLVNLESLHCYFEPLDKIPFSVIRSWCANLYQLPKIRECVIEQWEMKDIVKEYLCEEEHSESSYKVINQ